MAAANANRTSDLLTLLATERSSRETWQNRNQPSIGQYVDVQTNPNLNVGGLDAVAANVDAED